MTIFDEGKVIRGEIAKLRPDRRRTYPPELKQRILEWVARAMATGLQRSDCGHVLGIKAFRIKMWQEEPPPSRPVEALALVPIETAGWVATTGPLVVTPAGYRVEGLTVEQVAALLRELP